MSSRITQTADKIETKVSKGSVSSEISQEPDKVTLTANRLIVNSTGFNLDGNGNASFSGTITSSALNACNITGTNIYGSVFHAVGDSVADETRVVCDHERRFKLRNVHICRRLPDQRDQLTMDISVITRSALKHGMTAIRLYSIAWGLIRAAVLSPVDQCRSMEPRIGS